MAKINQFPNFQFPDDAFANIQRALDAFKAPAFDKYDQMLRSMENALKAFELPNYEDSLMAALRSMDRITAVIDNFSKLPFEIPEVLPPLVDIPYQSIIDSLEATLPFIPEEQEQECRHQVLPELKNENQKTERKIIFTLDTAIALLGLLLTIYFGITSQLTNKQLDRLIEQNDTIIAQNQIIIQQQAEMLEKDREDEKLEAICNLTAAICELNDNINSAREGFEDVRDSSDLPRDSSDLLNDGNHLTEYAEDGNALDQDNE